MKLFKRERAKQDIVECADYIALDNIDSAERFIAAVENALELLLDAPGAGALREYLNPALSGLRLWPVRGYEKYLIFYRVSHDVLEVVRVLHASRDIEYLLRLES